ncbi:metallophosphoesterase family protein [Microbacterium oleivorans]|uniref:metallophosphoesterase family protein n=1 Tax=Microbacterium oleivorans TaxID=273677 RepID=UPI00203A67F5|nr:metallophosphoesterase [Microbacterium oleivorans]MCM3696895.1 metallophosphoesterase [Microbacterium oleivorans]
MDVLEVASEIDLPDRAVWLLGDVHGNTRWIQRAFPAMKRSDPDVRTVLQLGDWWQDTRPVDHWAKIAGIDRVLVTLGNHEPYGTLAPFLSENPGLAVRISRAVWILPRPFRFRVGGRSFLSLGGATSADIEWRTEDVDWWPDEAITDAEVRDAISFGPVDVLLTHESPDATPVLEVRRVIEERSGASERGVAESTRSSRLMVDRLVEAIRPALHVHGHLHVSGVGVTSTRRVVSLGRDLDPGSIARLDLASLKESFLQADDVWHKRR